MKKWLAITLGILTAIGGFVDIGDLVANSETGARFGMRLAVVVVIGVVGICVYAEMCGRVVAVSGRPVFDLVRERLGPKVRFTVASGASCSRVIASGSRWWFAVGMRLSRKCPERPVAHPGIRLPPLQGC